MQFQVVGCLQTNGVQSNLHLKYVLTVHFQQRSPKKLGAFCPCPFGSHITRDTAALNTHMYIKQNTSSASKLKLQR